MRMETAGEALAAGRCLELRYDCFVRVVEVHAYGFTRESHAVMRAWQVRGGSTSGERTGWKLLRLDEARALAILDEPSLAPRPGYRRGDSAMARIVGQA